MSSCSIDQIQSAALVSTVGFFFDSWHFLITSRTARRAALLVLFLLGGRFLSFLYVHSSLPNFSWSVQRCGFPVPYTLNIWNFTNIIALEGQVPCAILKFSGFMCVFMIHNSSRFDCFSSINSEAITIYLGYKQFKWPLKPGHFYLLA